MASPPPPTSPSAPSAPPPPPPTEPTFPPSEAFDIIPLVHDLLSRLVATADARPPPIRNKDVDTEAIPIRQKLSRARVLVAELPDINRTIEEQEKEIKELEAKVRKQKEMLGAIKEMEAVKKAAAAE